MDTDDLPPAQGERHELAAEEELRIEVPFVKSSTCVLTLQKGSCELQGVELTLGKPITLTDGGFKLALFTWHGCVIDVDCEHVEISYTSDETNCNVAYVNTHAQLEVLRDEAVNNKSQNGPCVLIVGPQESGKSSLAKTLTAYACKLGRTPILVDLDPADNAISVPGSLTCCLMNLETISIDCYATTGVPPGSTPLVLWHGATTLSTDLWKAQVTAIGQKLEARFKMDEWARASGTVVNTNGWIQDEGYQLLIHAVKALNISVVLVMGHDRLYSMFKSNNIVKENSVKVIKVPRSGGVVSRNTTFLRQSRSRALKRYFYGDSVIQQGTRVPQLTPFLVQIKFDKIKIYKYSSMSLSASLLPVAATQTTEAVQLTPVDINEKLQHAVVAVCHPHAVTAYEESGNAADLYTAGVAGFCNVERVVMDSETLHLLSPCTGSLPSHTLLIGDITWME